MQVFTSIALLYAMASAAGCVMLTSFAVAVNCAAALTPLSGLVSAAAQSAASSETKQLCLEQSLVRGCLMSLLVLIHSVKAVLCRPTCYAMECRTSAALCSTADCHTQRPRLSHNVKLRRGMHITAVKDLQAATAQAHAALLCCSTAY